MDGSKQLAPQTVDALLQSRRLFLAFIEKRVESKEVAEDILQSAFVKGIEKSGAVRDDESAVAWFYRILRNAIIDHYRHREVVDRAQQVLLEELQRTTEVPEAANNEVCECVMHLARTLKPEYQQAIEIVDLEDGSLAELGDQARISPNNAAVRVHRARTALRERVQTACGLCATHGCLHCDCLGDGPKTLVPTSPK